MQLKIPTPAAWIETVLSDFDSFLLDHAASERKVSAMAMSLISHYPDKKELVAAMIDLAREELEHFHQVYQWVVKRNLILASDSKNHYVNSLLKLTRPKPEDYFLDRLLLAGIVEARGCERFLMVAEALPAGELKDFYMHIARAEARHHGLFVRLAKIYFSEEKIKIRLEELLEEEAKIVEQLPLRAAVH